MNRLLSQAAYGRIVDKLQSTLNMSVEVQGQIPGYAGYIPGKNNHVIGKRYTEATKRANECTASLTRSSNLSNLQDLVDSRPQGRNFLYAQSIPQVTERRKEWLGAIGIARQLKAMAGFPSSPSRHAQ